MITLEQGALVAGLLTILVGGVTRRWVYGWTFDKMEAQYEARLDELEQDRNYWRDYALRVLGATEGALDKTVAVVTRSAEDNRR